MPTPIYEGPVSRLLDTDTAFGDGVKAGRLDAAELLEQRSQMLRECPGELTPRENYHVRNALRSIADALRALP